MNRQPVIVNDTRTSRLTTMFTGDPVWGNVRALLDVPILVEGAVHGVLCLQHRDVRYWDEDDAGFANTTGLMLALSMEATQRQEAETRIEHLAWYDALTGLPNRNLLRETMRDMIMTASNRKRRMAAMLIDLDRFKDVNDTLGHLVGDALIKSAADVLRETVGEDGTVARLGGDEFVVLISEFVHRQEVALLAERIAQALHRTDLVPNIDTQVSASIGVALFPEHGRDMSTLLKNADAAMYQAKRDGRNQFSFFNPIRYERAAREVQLGIELVKAVQSENPQFICEYQPQIEMASGRVVGLEALIRWNHPVHGMLTPDRFIGVAEVSGLSERITRWVLNEVCSQINRWRLVKPDFDVPVAVNVAGREMGSTALPILVRSALVKHSIEPRLIVLEITERTLVKESEINNDVLAELASIGVGLVLDDFGTGYSMLGYLKRMPIHALKIDQSFIEGIPADPDSRAIVHAMLAVARHFRLKVVAEGVESQDQVDYMREIGCEFAQGFFYSRAISGDTILDYLARESAAS
jgi:diguanylate cyclase (GGDEF)-like protein